MTTKTTATSVIAARATGNKRAALYLRVSTDGQTTENQRLELAAVAERSGWHVVEVYEDHAISGAKGRDQRPAFDRLCKAATRREFDVVIPRRTPCPPLLP